MIAPRVAITAAHCVFDVENMDKVDPTYNGQPISVSLTNPTPGGDPFTTTIKEIRLNECYPLKYSDS